MAATLMDGKAVSSAVREKLALRAQTLRNAGIEPHLAVVLVGDDPASQIYVRNKERGCAKLGIRSTVIRLGADCTQQELEDTVRKLNEDLSVHGILVQLPLPRHLKEETVIALIDPRKDVDGFHAINTGNLMNGVKGFVPCTPSGVMEMLRYYDIPISGRNAVVVGRSNIVGKPMALLLLSENATVTICHSRTKDIASFTRAADILVVAAQVLAQLGAEDNAPVRSEVDAALRCFEEALRYRSVDDFTAKDRQGRRFYKPGLRFPGANHLHLLACTTGWRSASAVAAVRESFRHCTALMSETRETVFLKSGHLIGPFCFNWHLPEFCESDMETPYAFIFFVRELERLAGLAFLTDQLRGAYDTLWTLAAGRAVVERQSESSLRRLRRFAVEPYWRTPENRLCDLLFFALPALYRAGYDVAQLEKGD